MRDHTYEAKVIKVTQVSKNSAEALIRIVSATEGFRYVKFYAKHTGKQIAIVDWFDYKLGSNLSEVIGSLLDMLVPRSGFVRRIKDALGDKRQYGKMISDYGDIKTTGDV